mmetsp:Transcript_2934/g.6532  ORF Transcript_2934/g.6532 Transcript_2934/m.6532 type:complete len:423 (-) Transcript_2934:176-1444(-)
MVFCVAYLLQRPVLSFSFVHQVGRSLHRYASLSTCLHSTHLTLGGLGLLGFPCVCDSCHESPLGTATCLTKVSSVVFSTTQMYSKIPRERLGVPVPHFLLTKEQGEESDHTIWEKKRSVSVFQTMAKPEGDPIDTQRLSNQTQRLTNCSISSPRIKKMQIIKTLLCSSLLVASVLASSSTYSKEDMIRERFRKHRSRIEKQRGLIVGGLDVDQTRFPYFAILDLERADGFYFCGAALIHTDILLTSAACTQNTLNIFAAVNYTQEDPLTNYERFREAIKTVPHPDFNSTTNDYDLAALKLDFPVDQITPIPIDTSRPANGATLTTIGFGLTSEGGTFPNVLQEAFVNVVSFADCNSATSYDGKIRNNRMICANAQGRVSCATVWFLSFVPRRHQRVHTLTFVPFLPFLSCRMLALVMQVDHW